MSLTSERAEVKRADWPARFGNLASSGVFGGLWA